MLALMEMYVESVSIRKVRGAEYCGYSAAKKEKVFGWRLHLDGE